MGRAITVASGNPWYEARNRAAQANPKLATREGAAEREVKGRYGELPRTALGRGSMLHRARRGHELAQGNAGLRRSLRRCYGPPPALRHPRRMLHGWPLRYSYGQWEDSLCHAKRDLPCLYMGRGSSGRALRLGGPRAEEEQDRRLARTGHEPPPSPPQRA